MYVKRLDKLRENKFLRRQQLPKLTQEETKHEKPRAHKDHDSLIRCFPKRKLTAVTSIRHRRRNNTNYFQCHEPNFTQVQKPEKDKVIEKRETYRPISLTSTDTKTL